MSKQFYFKQFSLADVHSFNVKNNSISLPLRARFDLRAMAMKGYSAEKQLVYSTVAASWPIICNKKKLAIKECFKFLEDKFKADKGGID